MDGDERRASEHVDEHAGEALRLDGNAAAGILSEVFIPDITAARATCANCGTIRALGALLVYAHGMGMVAMSQLRRRRLARRAHAHAPVARPGGCEARRHGGPNGILRRVTTG